MNGVILILCTVLAGTAGYKAGKSDTVNKIKYLALAFLICVANACIQKMCF